MYCPTCGGDGGFLGRLGRMAWFRCRNCGMEFGTTVEDEGFDDFGDDAGGVIGAGSLGDLNAERAERDDWDPEADDFQFV